MRWSLAWLDPWVLRTPFEGRSAWRYASHERCAFGDLDERLLDRFAPELARARTFVDIGAGTGDFAEKVAVRHRHLRVYAVEPSRTYAGFARVRTMRARAERLPLAAGTVDFSLFLSALRHVRGRSAALAELRRVARPGGVAYVIELDPASDAERSLRHRSAMRSLWSQLTFDPWVLRTCPGPSAFADAARAAGWQVGEPEPDPRQPFYLLRLS